MSWLLSGIFKYVFFLGQPGRSAIMREILLSFPENFSLRMDTQHPYRRVFAFRRNGNFWSIIPAQALDNPTWILVFRSQGVLRRILFMQTSLHQAFIERRVALKGSIPESLRLLKVFDVLFSYLMPVPSLLKSLTRTSVPVPVFSKLMRVLSFFVRLPVRAFKKEFELS